MFILVWRYETHAALLHVDFETRFLPGTQKQYVNEFLIKIILAKLCECYAIYFGIVYL